METGLRDGDFRPGVPVRRPRPDLGPLAVCLPLVPLRRVCNQGWQGAAVAGPLILGTSHYTRSIRGSWLAGGGRRCPGRGPSGCLERQ